jgi:hypothetical protein
LTWKPWPAKKKKAVSPSPSERSNAERLSLMPRRFWLVAEITWKPKPFRVFATRSASLPAFFSGVTFW